MLAWSRKGPQDTLKFSFLRPPGRLKCFASRRAVPPHACKLCCRGRTAHIKPGDVLHSPQLSHGAERFVSEVDLNLVRGVGALFSYSAQQNSFSEPACAHDVWILQCSQVLLTYVQLDVACSCLVLKV